MRSLSANQQRVWRTGRNLARAKQYTVPTASCHDWRSTEKYRRFAPQYQKTVFRKSAFLAHGVRSVSTSEALSPTISSPASVSQAKRVPGLDAVALYGLTVPNPPTSAETFRKIAVV